MPVLYQTAVDIPSFMGINQTGDGYNMSLRYAREMENVDITGGSYQPMRAGQAIEQHLTKPIGTLACLSRRFNVESGKENVLVAIAGSGVWVKILDGDDIWVRKYNKLTNDVCDWVTYEINPEGSDAPIDVLLFTNAQDGMFCLYGNDLHVEAVETPKKFGCLARFNERIWGSGITEDPDMLVYSAPYDPFNWEQNNEIPEDGAGDITAPSWDGDHFLALRNFGSYLLAVKKNAIWRLSGTDPATYILRQQLGTGAIVENTVVANNTSVLALGWSGLVRYDGTAATPFQQDMVCDILKKRLNTLCIDKAVAIMRPPNIYMLAVPLDESESNNVILEYHATDRTFSLRTNIYVRAFLRVDDRIFYTTDTQPGEVFELNGKGNVLRTKWVSGYQDLGLKSSVKSTFTVYFLPEAEVPFPLTMGIRTEKKLKQKTLWIKPGKAYRVHMNVQGRYFRLELASDSAAPFRINGGFKIDMELDPD